MTTSRIATEAERTYYNCPDWCVRWDHAADEVGPGSPPLHFAADIGACGPQGNGFTSEVVVYLGKESATISDPNELRRVAADMVKAAEWLEAHR